MRFLVATLLFLAPILAVAQTETPVTQPGSTAPALPGQAAPAQPTGPRPQISFKETSHDFGTIKQGDKVEYVFEYTNSGQAPLVISNVQTTCGCTVSEFSKAPLAPGKTGTIKATFNSAGKVGRQNKVISVISNAVNTEERVRIVANVVPGDGQPLPEQKVEVQQN